MKDFRGKVAVITGAGSGIGRSLAVQLSQEGAHLALGDIDQVNLSQTRYPVSCLQPDSVLNIRVPCTFSGKV